MSGTARLASISALVLLCSCGGGGNGAGGGNGDVPPPPPGGGGNPPPGPTYSLVHAFSGGAEGANPYDGVIGDAAGNLYGTTWAGGDPNCDCGTVFMVDASGNLLTLHTFVGYPTDGANPSGPLTRDSAGNLYGATSSGGNGVDGYGTIFKLDAAGNETVLHHFTGGDGGFEPAGGVFRDSNGNLYGVTKSGGSTDLSPGTVFRNSSSSS